MGWNGGRKKKKKKEYLLYVFVEWDLGLGIWFPRGGFYY